MGWNMQELRTRLGTEELPVFCYEELDSTSSECRRRMAAGQQRCLVLAERQTGGRGRSGKRFFSPEGGLYLSLAMPVPPDVVGLTCRTAVIAAEAIEAVTGNTCGIKWVNDLYFRGKKVCGILTEAVPEGVIIGIGINLSPTAVPPELRDIVGFLDCPEARERLAGDIAARLVRPWDGEKPYMECYRDRSAVLGRELACFAGERVFSARALEIDDEGGLVVLGPRGRETLRFGEVRILGKFE